MTLDHATLADLDDLAALRVEMLCEEAARDDAFRRTLYQSTRAFLHAGMDTGGVAACLVRNDAGEPVAGGCANYFFLPPNDWCPTGHTAYIGNLYTRPAWRGQGVAGRLLEALLADARARGCERVLLNTSEAGRGLYERFGFEPSDTAMALYPNGIRPLG